MMYTFRNVCKEMPELTYDDGLTFVYFNIGGTIGGNEEIKSLLTYLKCSIIDNVVDDTTRTIHNYVEHTKQSLQWRGKYMTIGEMLDEERDNGFQRGQDAGRSDVCISLIRKGLLSITEAVEQLGVDEASLQLELDK